MATQKQVAEHLDMSDRQVRELVAQHILPQPSGRNGFDLDECRMRYFLYLRGVAAGRSGRS